MGKIIVLVGPSASGKTTVQDRLGFPKIITTTTRPKREGEQSGLDYHFLSLEKFKRAIVNEEFVEYVEYAGNLYGSLKQTIEAAIESEGYHSIVLDIQGALKLKGMFPVHVIIVVVTAPVNIIKARMEKRGDGPDVINKRLDRMSEDKKLYYLADEVLVNDDIEMTVAKIKQKINTHFDAQK